MLESESGYCTGKAYIWIWVSYTNSPTFLSWVCFSSVIAEDIFDSQQKPMCHMSFTSFLLLSCQRVEVLEMICAHCAAPSSWGGDKSLRQRHCVPNMLHLTPPTSFVSPWCHMGTEYPRAFIYPVALFFQRKYHWFPPLSRQGHAS